MPGLEITFSLVKTPTMTVNYIRLDSKILTSEDLDQYQSADNPNKYGGTLNILTHLDNIDIRVLLNGTPNEVANFQLIYNTKKFFSEDQPLRINNKRYAYFEKSNFKIPF